MIVDQICATQHRRTPASSDLTGHDPTWPVILGHFNLTQLDSSGGGNVSYRSQSTGSIRHVKTLGVKS